jgi:hypothetical protein
MGIKCAELRPPRKRKNTIGSDRKPQMGQNEMQKLRGTTAAQASHSICYAAQEGTLRGARGAREGGGAYAARLPTAQAVATGMARGECSSHSKSEPWIPLTTHAARRDGMAGLGRHGR